ncbi:MAG: MFS transporter [Pseudomonadota bacterium]
MGTDLGTPPAHERGPGKAAVLVSAMCLAQVAGMLGVFAFPALLPNFLDIWGLSNSQAGWINGIYFAGYTVAVPLLTSLTDRMDARKIYVLSCGLGVMANLGFAFLSQGFWTALIFRAMSGLGLAGTFIPGLKAVIDRLEPRFLPRAVSFYTACFGLGMSASFYVAGKLFAGFGWKSVFAAAAAGSGFSLAASLAALVPRAAPGKPGTGILAALDFRPVWQNRPARIYIMAYMCHMWEMFAARSWMVAFLSFALMVRDQAHGFMAPTTVMAVAGIGGMMSSIGFGELALRLGRRRVVTGIMVVSCILAMTLGFLARIPYPALAGLCMVYTLFFQGDSAAIHAGVITAAPFERRGATMALQSLGGFMAASLGSVVTGMVLDITGNGLTPLSWGITFGTMGMVAALGSLLVAGSRHAGAD